MYAFPQPKAHLGPDWTYKPSPLPLQDPGRVLAGDGNSSIEKFAKKHRPNTKFIRDRRHLVTDLHPKYKPTFRTLAAVPSSRKDEVVSILEQLKNVDRKCYDALLSVPLEQWCPSFMTDGLHTMGNFTSNLVEILAAMCIHIREQNTLAGSLFGALLFIRSRFQDIMKNHVAQSLHLMVPLRVQRLLDDALSSAIRSKCAVVEEQSHDPLTAFSGTVLISMTRHGRLELHNTPRSEDDELEDNVRRAWSLVIGDASTVRQSHMVNLSCLNTGDWANLCTCGTNCHSATFCSHVIFYLKHTGFLSAHDFIFKHKPWNTVDAWKRQLSMPDQSSAFLVNVDSVLSSVFDLKDSGCLEKFMVVPTLSIRHRKSKILYSQARRMRPDEMVARSPDFMRQSVAQASSARAPGVRHRFNATSASLPARQAAMAAAHAVAQAVPTPSDGQTSDSSDKEWFPKAASPDVSAHGSGGSDDVLSAAEDPASEDGSEVHLPAPVSAASARTRRAWRADGLAHAHTDELFVKRWLHAFEAGVQRPVPRRVSAPDTWDSSREVAAWLSGQVDSIVRMESIPTLTITCHTWDFAHKIRTIAVEFSFSWNDSLASVLSCFLDEAKTHFSTNTLMRLRQAMYCESNVDDVWILDAEKLHAICFQGHSATSRMLGESMTGMILSMGGAQPSFQTQHLAACMSHTARAHQRKGTSCVHAQYLRR